MSDAAEFVSREEVEAMVLAKVVEDVVMAWCGRCRADAFLSVELVRCAV